VDNRAVLPRKIHLALVAAALLATPGISLARGLGDESGARNADNVPVQDRVDINHASLKELLSVPGMTRSWAGRILRFRPYHAKNDLLEHGIVSPTEYERIKDYLIAHRIKQ
jgi:DNA uptake protein ComE-like DNA-binding protein